MKRRKFLKTTSSAVSLPLLLNGMGVSVLPKTSIFSAINDDTDRVLVLIQLNGGNDGLNMIIPIDQYDNLANARPNIIIPQGKLLPVEDTLGFHPALTGLKSLYDDANLAVIQSVGYPNQNRSHFRSTDIWSTGSAAEEFLTTGWLGRYFERDNPAFPEGFPNAANPDPFALTIGSLVSETCQGTAGNFSLAINDPFNLNPLATGGEDAVPDTPYGEELTFLRQTIEQTNAYEGVITAAAESGNSLADYPEDNLLAQRLKNVALLISGGLKTKVYVVSLGGFDTHANQVAGGDVTFGNHAELLKTLSDAITAFQNDLKKLGLEKRVIGMTFSEFGRRIRSNASFGTDHGDAAPLIVFGNCIKAGIFGDNPEIAPEVGIGEAVPMQHDFRNVYGSILAGWFKVSRYDVQDLLFDGFKYIPIIEACAVEEPPSIPPPQRLVFNGNGAPVTEVSNYPNPFPYQTTITFYSNNEQVRLSVFNGFGQQVKMLLDAPMEAGRHEIIFDGSDLPPGNYYYHLQLEGSQKTKLMSIIR